MLGILSGLATKASGPSSRPSPPAPAHIWCSAGPSKWHYVNNHPGPQGPEVNLLVKAPCWGVISHHYLQEGLPGWRRGQGLPLGGFGRLWGTGFCQRTIPSSLLAPIPGMLRHHLPHLWPMKQFPSCYRWTCLSSGSCPGRRRRTTRKRSRRRSL